MKLFGTDGIRGKANSFPVTCEVALKIGQALGCILKKTKPRFKKGHVVLIGKDTRISGYMLEQALASGLNSVGVWVNLTGPLPTPGIGFLAQNMRVDAGVILSASHNPFYDNGIKIFDSKGFKISNEWEKEIEKLVEKNEFNLVQDKNIGRTRRIDDALGRYIVYAKNCFPVDKTLEGFKIVLDSAHGACYKAAPRIFRELGAEVISTGNEPNGFNINDKVGALHPEHVCKLVKEHKADLGISLDGDGDRVILVDEKSQVLDGDHILAICATHRKKKNNLDTIVATHMSNYGLEDYLKSEGIKMIRTDVGDRHVVSKMLEKGCSLGGESSGHIVCLENSTTGDGCISALNVLSVMCETKKSLSHLRNLFTPYPSKLTNIKVKQKTPLEDIKGLKELKSKIESELNSGRLFIRYSGTEPLLRILVEAKDQKQVDKYSLELENFFKDFFN